MRPLSDQELEQSFKGAVPEEEVGPVRELGLQRVLESVVGTEPVPTRIGRFVIEKKIGHSSRGVVFRAFDPQLDRALIVKLVRTTGSEREELLREAKILAGLRHPQVVAVYDVGTAGDSVYVAMEHVAGVSLRTWLRAHPDAKWREIVELFVRAGHGLSAVHQAGLAHNEFGLDTVIVGEGGRVRLIGFGGGHGELDRGAVADQLAFLRTLRDSLLRRAGAEAGLPKRLRKLTTLASQPQMGTELSLPSLVRTLEMLLVPDRQDRERSLLLERVQRFWIDGLLEESLRGGSSIALRLRAAEGALDEPSSTEMPAGATTRDLPQLLERSRRGLLVLGAAGRGKTTVLLELARTLLEEARVDSAQPAPVVLNLSSWPTSGGALERWVEAELLTKYSLPRSSTRRWLDKGELVLLLDGLDEVDKSRQDACIEAINTLVRARRIDVVVCCRENDYASMQGRLALGAAVVVQPLDDEGVAAFLEHLGEQGETLRAAIAQDRELHEQARIPLILRVLEVAGVEDGEDPARLRDAMHRRYIDAAFERRMSRSPYSREQMLAGLTWLAQAMRRERQSELWLERLQARWLPTRGQHFAAFALGILAALVLVFVLNTVPVRFHHSSMHSLRSGAAVAIVVIPVTLAFVRTLRIRPVEALTWSWDQLKRRLAPTLGWGLVGAAGYGALFSMELTLIQAAPALLVLAAVRGLHSAELPAAVRPNQGIRQSARNALFLGISVGAGTGLFFALVVEPVLKWQIGPEAMLAANVKPGWPTFFGSAACFGSIAALIYGGWAVILHACLRVVISASSPLPLRLRPFLDEAAERGLMRRVGGGYIFVHQTLLEYLANQTKSRA